MTHLHKDELERYEAECLSDAQRVLRYLISDEDLDKEIERRKLEKQRIEQEQKTGYEEIEAAKEVLRKYGYDVFLKFRG